MAAPVFGEELEKFKQYIRSNDNEDAKRPLLYPLFQKLFKDKFKIESNVHGADIYVQGQIIVESKTDASQWLEGFYQALHYQKKYGLAYNTIMVIAHKFIGIWKVNKIPEFAIILSHTADSTKAPNVIGKDNARKTAKVEKQNIIEAAFYWLQPKDLEGDIFGGAKNLTTESYEILKILKNLDSDRLQINTHNFISAIERMKVFFENPIDAVHAFYTIVAYWDITSTLATNDDKGEARVVGFKGSRLSDAIRLPPNRIKEFKTFIEVQYIFTNEGSGLTVDYYFSRFDEVMAKIDPEYVKQHGIFFTDANLSKFALWFAKYHFPGNIDENYIVFDPAGGSGNLISSWRGRLKHKVISELQPDLLRTIERRMNVDPFHVETGFTIIPKTSDNAGLNFIDIPAKDYLEKLKKELLRKNIFIDKPFAFLLNPPYKNTDENQKVRDDKDAEYKIHDSILALTGEDAGKERYLAFLGQILNIAKEETTKSADLAPIVMVFTPTSWLLPRPSYKKFRIEWDKYFELHSGFLITGNEFFKIQGRWPLAFTIWDYKYNEKGNENFTQLFDLTDLKKSDLNIVWTQEPEKIDGLLNKVLAKKKTISLNNLKGDIRSLLPLIKESDSSFVKQSRLNLYRNRTSEEKEKKIVSGFPLNDLRHSSIKAPHGQPLGTFIGFMDDCTPLRITQDPLKRQSHLPNRIWFRLDNDIKGMNKSKVFNGPSDNRSYCAYDLESAKATCTWFALTKVLNGRYPVWANQYDIWPPKINPKIEAYWFSLCFAFVLAENRCVVTKFEENNPIIGAPAIFVDNPLCPVNKDSFWSSVLEPFIQSKANEIRQVTNPGLKMIELIKHLYRTFNLNYCKGQFIENVGLGEESYFKFFQYPDFITPFSGLIQIKKYAELNNSADLEILIKEITNLSKSIKEEMYSVIIKEFKYFE